MNAIEARELIESYTLVTLKEWISLEIKRRMIEHTEPLKPDVKSLDDNLIWVDRRARIGDGASFFPPLYIMGDTVIGKNAVIETGTIIRDAIIGDECSIGPYAEIYHSKIGSKTTIGHARIEDCTIGEECEIGYTTQIKRSQINNGVRAKHHCYIGDAIIGDCVNIGAGFITANYDGTKKNKTIIGEGTFLGVNVNLVAPLEIGPHAMVAAGSTIKDNVLPYTLVVARAKAHQSKTKYHRATRRGHILITIPAKRLEQLEKKCKFNPEQIYNLLTTPNLLIDLCRPIDLLSLEKGEELFDQFLLKTLNVCNLAPL